jgi:hypothetical protein
MTQTNDDEDSVWPSHRRPLFLTTLPSGNQWRKGVGQRCYACVEGGGTEPPAQTSRADPDCTEEQRYGRNIYAMGLGGRVDFVG